jgi:GNAT superfamily N-acetyltransferase
MDRKVRKARIDDAQAILDLRARTVRRINSRDYSPAQIDAWIGNPRVEVTRSMIADGQYYVCVDREGNLLGFGGIKASRLFALYVSAEHQGEGIGSGLLKRMEKDAARKGFLEMETESTLTAETFYKRKGYQEVERKRRKIARGEMLEVVVLKKALTSQKSR